MESIITNPTTIYTANEFIDKAWLAAENPSCYVTGCFGAPLDMPGVIERWEAEYSKNKKYDALMRDRAAAAVELGEHCFGFDCVNLVKAILWGWDADGAQEYGGAKYQSNGVPDTTVDGIFDMCTEKSSDFSGIKPGAMLYMSNGGHCGIYIGDGLAIEATGSWDRMIYVTALNNLQDVYPNAEYDKRRTWQKWGLLPWIDYSETEEESKVTVNAKIICPCCGKELNAALDLTLSYRDEVLATYTVKQGDTPWGIAQRYYGNGSLYYIIMEYNGFDRSAPIHTGQKLKIPRI